MKEKDILKIIKSDITKDTPNLLDKIDLASIKIKEDNIKEISARQFNLFKFLRASISMAVLILVVVIAYNLIKTDTDHLDEYITVTSKDEIVASYAVTGVNLVATNNQHMNLSVNNYMFSTNFNEIVDEFHKYFYLIEDYFGLIEHDITITLNTENDFKYKMVVKTTNTFSAVNEYILYYDEKREVDQDETNKEMNGVLIYNSIIYNFYSEEESDTEESEVKVVIYQTNYMNRIEIEKELEVDEYQFKYEVFGNNNTILLIELEVEEDEIQLTIEKDDLDYEYYITKITNNKYNISKDDDEFITLEVDLINKKYQYIINDTVIIK